MTMLLVSLALTGAAGDADFAAKFALASEVQSSFNTKLLEGKRMLASDNFTCNAFTQNGAAGDGGDDDTPLHKETCTTSNECFQISYTLEATAQGVSFAETTASGGCTPLGLTCATYKALTEATMTTLVASQPGASGSVKDFKCSTCTTKDCNAASADEAINSATSTHLAAVVSLATTFLAVILAL